MEKLTARANKIKARSIAARAERLNGKMQNGKTAGLPYISGETIPTKWHPRRAKDFASYQRFKSIVIGEPGRATEEAMIRALRFETQSKDAEIFRQALAGNWRGRRS